MDEIGILVDVLASAIGAPTNPSKIANTFASERQMTYANKTISKHIDHLTDAFLISKASRYDIKGRKYIGANLKYYFTDLGLRNARLNFRQQEPTHIMEIIVYNELLIRGYNVDVGVVDILLMNGSAAYVARTSHLKERNTSVLSNKPKDVYKRQLPGPPKSARYAMSVNGSDTSSNCFTLTASSSSEAVV